MRKALFLILLILLSCCLPLPSSARDKKGHFIVVIDPGHGGRDTGAKGKKSKEKDIVLKVAKKVGTRIKALNPDITVYYTRASDKFIGLQERADYAIEKHADLFVSIHANSTRSSSAYGAETWVLGLHKSEENLEVAMKENSVILLEEDYTRKYEDFDPSSSESYIIFQFMQNKHLDASISLARLIQKGFKGAGRRDRGVRQSGFLVLRRTSMPSVLVELGFISNRSEEAYLLSSKGQNRLSSEIAEAVVEYEKEVSRKNGGLTDASSSKKKAEKKEEETKDQKKEAGESKKTPARYRIQVFASDKPIPKNHALYRTFGAKNVKYYREGGFYKYTLYDTSDLSTARKRQKELRRKYKDCFIVGFDKNGDKVGSYY